jgi:hypothetical protein
MRNLYAIKCLQSIIGTHQKEIEILSKEDSESYGAVIPSKYIFIEEEIKERQGYITQLKEAIKKLSKK